MITRTIKEEGAYAGHTRCTTLEDFVIADSLRVQSISTNLRAPVGNQLFVTLQHRLVSKSNLKNELSNETSI